eukprot:6195435-Pleurochrysis_carterae.AAC.1
MSAAPATTSNHANDNNYVNISDFANLYRLLPWQKELIARRWAKHEDKYFADASTLRTRWYYNLLSLWRRPAGCADRPVGSQQCVFELDLPAKMCLIQLGLGSTEGMEYRCCKKYTINQEGNIEWKEPPSISTYYIKDKRVLAHYLAFQTRSVAFGVVAYGSSKGVVVRNEGVEVMCTLIPPLIVEVCTRRHGRLVLTVSVNLLPYNDHDNMNFPPGFRYAGGERAKFRRLVHEHLMGKANSGVLRSRRMCKLLPPAYRNGEDEGGGAEDSETGAEEL